MPTPKTLAAKLLLKPDTKVAVLNAPRGYSGIEGARTVRSAEDAQVLVVYCRSSGEVETHVPSAKTLEKDARVWIAYPKAKQLGTDLSRERLWALAAPLGWEAYRQVAIDDVWSALAFKAA